MKGDRIMPRKKKNQPEVKNDFAVKEIPEEICTFNEMPAIEGTCIASFSFSDENNTNEEVNVNDTYNSLSNMQCDNNADSTINEADTASVTNFNTDDNNTNQEYATLFPSLISTLSNGASPSIDGETPSIKRTYILRDSSVRKLNEIKSIHPDLTVCISTIVDLAIEHYYNHIAEEANKNNTIF